MAGYLASGLKLRRERGLSPIAILSCDNISKNGTKLREAVTRIARAHDTDLALWIEDNCPFPNSMVDRIVPATSREDIERARAELGLIDQASVRTEPFSQWVIEHFEGERPELERHGVQFTSDVAPFEEAKLRLLNGAHSAMAYLGGLAGIETVDAFISKAWGVNFVRHLWSELAPTLRGSADLDLGDYQQMLLRRFANPALGHRLDQIAADGSQKIPQRLVPPFEMLLERNEEPRAIALVIAAWIRWQLGRRDSGEMFNVDDPLGPATAKLLKGASDAKDQLRSILTLRSIFPERLASDRRFQDLLAGHLKSLDRLGARETLERLGASEGLALEGEPRS